MLSDPVQEPQVEVPRGRAAERGPMPVKYVDISVGTRQAFSWPIAILLVREGEENVFSRSNMGTMVSDDLRTVSWLFIHEE